MKGLQKLNLVLFPYVTTMLGFWLCSNHIFFLGGAVVLIAFVSWLISLGAYYAEIKNLEL